MAVTRTVSVGMTVRHISLGAARADTQGVGPPTSKNVARAHALGIALTGDAFRCVLPDHDDRAELLAGPHGTWSYQCSEIPALPLARVRAMQAGRWEGLSKVELSRWLERLDHEAGLVEPVPVPLDVSDRWPESTIAVARGLALFVGLRDPRWDGQPFVFARKFVMAYCAVTDEQARRAMETLERDRVIVRVGDETRRAQQPIKWRLHVGRS